MSIQRIGLIACSKLKRPEASPARDLYCSPLFLASRRYIEPRCDEWAILSARWGLVMPEEIIQPYDQTLHELKPYELRKWADRTYRQIVGRWPSTDSTIFVAVAGGRYRMCLKDNMRLEMPFGSQPIGMLLQSLNAANTGAVSRVG